MNIIQTRPYLGNIIDTVLENRGIVDKERFFNPDNTDQSLPENFKNAKEGKDLLLKELSKDDHKIVIIVDQDADGFTSAAMLYQFLKYLDNGDDKIEFLVHEFKAHGLTDPIMEKIWHIEPTLVIVPDAGSNDVAQIELLENNNIRVLVLDHHVVTEWTDKGIIVNNQLCENTNDRFVGAGVVYKFIQLIDEEYGLDVVDRFLDLFAVGQIGDASDISNNEIRYLVKKGLENITNGFLSVAIGEKNGLGIKLAPKDLSFGVIPIINAVTRVGTLEERETLFKAMAHIDTDQVFTTVKKKKNKATGKFENVTFDFNIFQHAYDVATKCKSRQDSAVKKMVEQIDSTLVDDAGVIIAFSGGSENPGISGLMANKLVSKYDKPALLLNEKEGSYFGSGRGHEKTIADFREWCEKSGFVVFAQGHDNAFGIEISKDKIEQFKEYSRTIKKQDVLYDVDYLTNKPDKELCELIDRNKSLFGGVVSEPFIGIKKMSVPKRFISVKGSMLSIYSWGVNVVKFGASEELLHQIENCPSDDVVFDVVGYYSINDWGGRNSPQLVIKDIEVIYNDTEEEINEENIIF
jgi:single-stranded-DNA-specific exonuclease